MIHKKSSNIDFFSFLDNFFKNKNFMLCNAKINFAISTTISNEPKNHYGYFVRLKNRHKK